MHDYIIGMNVNLFLGNKRKSASDLKEAENFFYISNAQVLVSHVTTPQWSFMDRHLRWPKPQYPNVGK